MDIQNLTNVSTVVINSLLMLLKDNHVDVNSVVMQLSNNKDEAISPEVNLGELAQQTLGELQAATDPKVAVPEGFVLVEKKILLEGVNKIEQLFEDDPLLALGELLPIQQGLKATIEAQEQVHG